MPACPPACLRSIVSNRLSCRLASKNGLVFLSVIRPHTRDSGVLSQDWRWSLSIYSVHYYICLLACLRLGPWKKHAACINGLRFSMNNLS